MISNWTHNDLDEKIAQELRSFLPENIFDMHAHIYRVEDMKLSVPTLLSEGPAEITTGVWRSQLERLFGKGRLKGGLLIALFTVKTNLDNANDFVLEQLENEPYSKGSIAISPSYPAERAAEYVNSGRIIGLKPYHFFSELKPTWHAPISSYLPEWAWKMADRHGLVITLHMVRDLAVADPENQREIVEMCTRYPNARLVLAHAARCFHAPNAAKGLPALRGLENIWFDLSAVCEAEPVKAILYEFGPRKLLWGSDYPVAETRGKAVTIGDSFIWLQPDTINWNNLTTACNPILTGLESLRALKAAADDFGLDGKDIEDIFCNNAMRLLGFEHEGGSRTQDLYEHAKERIPGGAQLMSKRPEMMAPGQWPAYFREARGCEVWDIDGRHYYDMSNNSVGACLLGYRDPDVTRAVRRRISLGSICSLNPPEEVELADMLCEIHPWAHQVRFVRGGGEACAVAVRIARAATDRSITAICGYHGWHDWYLAANLGKTNEDRGSLLPGLEPMGVPAELRGTAVTFTYNDREEFKKIIDTYGAKLAAVIMEPCRHSDPEPGFLEYVRDEAHKCGALLIFDEVSIGWRLYFGGAHMKFGIYPDIAAFAKALGNGHPIGAVIGSKEAMEGARKSFISSTYWTDAVGPAAAIATLKKMKRLNVPEYVARAGGKVSEYWERHAKKHNLHVKTGDGYPCLAHFSFEHESAVKLRTLYTQLMLERGFLSGPAIYATMAHTDEIIDSYGKAVDEVFSVIAAAMADNAVEKILKSSDAVSTFKRLL